jgi:hypothetical protein
MSLGERTRLSKRLLSENRSDRGAGAAATVAPQSTIATKNKARGYLRIFNISSKSLQ